MSEKSLAEKICKSIWINCKIISRKRFFRAHTYPVLDIKLTNPKKEIVVKIITDPAQFSRGKFESNVFKLLSSYFPDFPVPEIIKQDSSLRLIKWPFIVEERLAGKALADLGWKPIKNKKELIIQLARYASQMNSIKFKSFGYFDENLKIKPQKWKDLIENELAGYLNRIKKNSFLSSKDISKAENYIKSNIHLMNIRNKPSFIHNDYSGCNINIAESHGEFFVSGIFDFQLCMSGDLVRELYKAEWILADVPKYRADFYEEYEKHVSLPRNYKQRLEFYELLGRLKHVHLRDVFEKSENGRKVIQRGIRIVRKIIY